MIPHVDLKLMTQHWYHKPLVRVKDRLSYIESPPRMVVDRRHAPIQVYVEEIVSV